MISLMAMIGAAAAAAAVGLIVLTLTDPPRAALPTGPQRSLSQLWAHYTRRPPGAEGRRRDMLLGAGLVGGVVAFLLTGWLVLIVLVPLAVVVGPKLLGQAPQTDLPLLEALDRWVRTLATIVPLGRDVIGTIRASRASAPPLLADHVSALVARMDRGMDPREALQRFADELNNPEADSVVASLMLATHRTQGLTANLLSVADAIQERMVALRQIETERSRPRQSARIVTILSALMIIGASFAGDLLIAYTTPIGQLLLTVLIGGYVASMLMLYRVSQPRRRHRILVRRQVAS